MRKVEVDVDRFLGSFPEDVAATMVELDAIVTSSLHGRSRTLWEGTFWGGTDQRIVGYGDIVQPRPRGEPIEWFLVGLARQQRTYSVYVNAVDDGAYLLAGYADRLGTVNIGSASVGFRALDDLDLPAFRALLARAHELTPPDAASAGEVDRSAT